MNMLRAVLAELASLFIDDIGFAAAILAWIVVCGLAGFPAAVFALGLMAVLLESAVRRARKGGG